jgi:hypothetical protein
MAEDVLEAIKFYAITADYDNNSLINNSLNNFRYKFPEKIVVDSRWYQLDENISIRLQDTSALLNVLKPSVKRIAELATTNEQRQLRYVIADSIKDWIDKDNFVQLNGAESSIYELQKNVEFKIRNNPDIQNIQELRLINGIDLLNEKQWEDLKEKLYFGNGAIPNLSLIDAQYLAYLLNISDSYAETLINIRENDLQKFVEVARKLNGYNDDLMGFYLSRQYKIQIRVSIGNAATQLNTIIDFKKSKQSLYTVISYNMK